VFKPLLADEIFGAERRLHRRGGGNLRRLRRIYDMILLTAGAGPH
jgi:hypothetical protein